MAKMTYKAFLEELATFRGTFGFDRDGASIRHKRRHDALGGRSCQLNLLCRTRGSRFRNSRVSEMAGTLGLTISQARFITEAADYHTKSPIISKTGKQLRRKMLKVLGLTEPALKSKS